MGGDTLTEEEIEIVLGKVNYPNIVRGTFKDISDVTAGIDNKISEIMADLKKVNQKLNQNTEKLEK